PRGGAAMSAGRVIRASAETLEVPVEATGVGAEAQEKERALLHMPIDVRSTSMIVIASLLGLDALRLAAPTVTPVLVALLFSSALTPLVDRIVRLGVPRPLGAAVVMVALVGSVAWGAWSLT